MLQRAGWLKFMNRSSLYGNLRSNQQPAGTDSQTAVPERRGCPGVAAPDAAGRRFAGAGAGVCCGFLAPLRESAASILRRVLDHLLYASGLFCDPILADHIPV